MTALTANGLTRRFGDLMAVNNVTFESLLGCRRLRRTQWLGEVDHDQVLLGLIAPSSGTGTVLGEPIEDPQRLRVASVH